MNDPRRPRQTRPAQPGGQPTVRRQQPYPPYTEPAHGGRGRYPGPPERTGPPTEQLPLYPPPDPVAADQPPSGQPREPKRPKAPRWLWIAAAGAVLLVVALVLALVVVNGSSRNQTTVSPLPETPSSSTTTAAPSSTPSATSSTESSTESSQTTVAGPTEAVVYNVTGEGRAISITYVDNDGVTQTEFNVALPWNKEVNLPKSGEHHPSVTIVNIGHQVTCSVTVAGVEVRQHTGAGLTICDAAN